MIFKLKKSSRSKFILYYSLFFWIITALPVLSQRYYLYYEKYNSFYKAIAFSFAEGLLVYSISVIILGFYTIIPYLGKVLLTISAVLSVSASYAIYFRGVSISSQLVLSLYRTNYDEVSQMLSITDVIYVSLLSIVVIAPVWIIKFNKYNGLDFFKWQFWLKKSAPFIFLIIFGIFINIEIAFSEYGYFPIRALRGLYPPLNYLNATFDFIKLNSHSLKDINNLIPLADKDNPLVNIKKFPEKLNVILVLGETARLQNHQVYGYARKNTPNIVNMVNGKDSNIEAFYYKATSCGTYTAFSVPCILSPLDKKQMTLPVKHKGLLSAFDGLGFKKYWISTQIGYGDKWFVYNYSMADEYLIREQLITKIVGHNELVDGDMLPYIQKWANNNKSNLNIYVIHMEGSHISYRLRYPLNFEKYKSKDTSKILDNSHTVVDIEAYDNSIYYSDYVLKQIVDIFKNKGPMLLLYTSDHGESIGEKFKGKVYLGHGADYELKPNVNTVIDDNSLSTNTPPEQYNVPMYLIVNKDYIRAYNLNTIQMKADEKLMKSHDNIYSSILYCTGLMNKFVHKEKSLCIFK